MSRHMYRAAICALAAILFTASCARESPQGETHNKNNGETGCRVEFVILGIGQDGGAPQIDHHDDPAWQNLAKGLLPSSGALIDYRSQKQFLFEATPEINKQLYALGQHSGNIQNGDPLGLAGVFLTHAHIGHYTGLMFAGHESAGASGLNVYAMPRMRNFLETNGPWDQLVAFENITLNTLSEKSSVRLANDIAVTPYLVPHRDEYSETVAFMIAGPSRKLLFLPDIDDWDLWETQYQIKIENMIAQADRVYLDATFFDNDELPGRDMSKIPHPRVRASIDRFSAMPTTEQQKVRFFHINHTNALRDPSSDEYQFMIDKGFKLAKRGETFCLD